ncbi:MAG: protein-L-isoaspartate(D-aspartate) O-methyltransferase [Rhodothermales bacterium]
MPDSDRTYRKRARRLVEMLRDKGIDNDLVLRAMSIVPRHIFVDHALRRLAYQDEALPIGLGQTISQPYTVAFQTASLDPQPGDCVLEIGTGSGYQAAILAEMGVRVYSIERHEQLLQRAREHLRTLGYRVITKIGDGSEGWPAFAPFDGILATAGAARIPAPLINQLRAPAEDIRGGRLIIPVGQSSDQTMIRISRTGEDTVVEERLGRFSFVPFVGADTGHAPDPDIIGSNVQ